jgi:hypothetical protein
MCAHTALGLKMDNFFFVSFCPAALPQFVTISSVLPFANRYGQ